MNNEIARGYPAGFSCSRRYGGCRRCCRSVYGGHAAYAVEEGAIGDWSADGSSEVEVPPA
ncbi:MAG: hypothetical protein ACLTQI_03660 [Slackia sp.]